MFLQHGVLADNNKTHNIRITGLLLEESAIVQKIPLTKGQ